MVRKDSVVLLRKAAESDKSYVNACLEEDIPVVCANRETGKIKNMPFKVLYSSNKKFWMQNEVWEYFLSKEDNAKILEKTPKTDTDRVPETVAVAAAVTATAPPVVIRKKETITPEEPDIGFGREYEAVKSMTETERVQHVEKNKKRLDDLLAQKPRQEALVTEALVEATSDAVLNNHASIMDTLNLSDDEAKKQTQCMVNSTYELVKSSAKLISENIFNDDLMNTLVAKSNGTIIQHMTRVYLNGLAFLSYYNKLVSSSSAINKLRAKFEEKFRFYYKSLLPDIHPALESVYMGGMRTIPENDFYNWAVGFLIHDIGKAAAVEYHEGEAAYNRDIVTEHVKVGYDSVTHKTNYPRDAGLITGYHHEYYGDQAGYGYFRSELEQYKKTHPLTKQKFCMAFNISALLNFEALAFFPVKVLEIIDVFDSVTDPNRKYRKPMSTEEALSMMREEFIEKHKKIDYILFDIFSEFVRDKEYS